MGLPVRRSRHPRSLPSGGRGRLPPGEPEGRRTVLLRHRPGDSHHDHQHYKRPPPRVRGPDRRRGVESGAGAPALGSGGRAVAFAPGLNPAPMAAFPVPRSPNPACSFPAPGSPLGSCTSHTGSVGPTVAGRVAAQGATAESCTAPGLATAAASPAIEPVDASMDRFRTTDTRRPETALHFSM